MLPEKTFSLFKYGVYALLVINVYLFFRHATFHEGVDCVGWVMLLAAFEWQTRREESASSPRAEKISLTVELAAYALILYAWAKYFLHAQWLDFVNASLWLGVVGIISADVYWKTEGARMRRLLYCLKFPLYAGLIAVAILWGMEGEFLNFYDAFLWIVCFFAIELNLLRHAHRYFLNISLSSRGGRE